MHLFYLGDTVLRKFRAVSVFDVSQTDGKPIPELEALELLSTVEGYEDFVNALMYLVSISCLKDIFEKQYITVDNRCKLLYTVYSKGG